MPLYTLSPRLAACASLLRPGRALIDVGTDHAYLPIWLLKAGLIPQAVACDVKPGPLKAAQRHAKLYQVGEELRLVLSDGLQALGPADGDDIVIAGMGGELILRIITETRWLRAPGKRLILQPMSAAGKLRGGLWELGFPIIKEEAVQDGKKVYSAFAVSYTGQLPAAPPLYITMGRLMPGEPGVSAYAAKTARQLAKRLQGAEHEGDAAAAQSLRQEIEEIARKYPIETGGAYGKNL